VVASSPEIGAKARSVEGEGHVSWRTSGFVLRIGIGSGRKQRSDQDRVAPLEPKRRSPQWCAPEGVSHIDRSTGAEERPGDVDVALLTRQMERRCTSPVHRCKLGT
jgi:hypothetical protein